MSSHEQVRALVLLRHSIPEINPDVPAAAWHLSAEGRQRCAALAAQLAAFRPSVIATSTEPKALQTAELVAARLGLSVTTDDALREHDRAGLGYLAPSAFQGAMAAFFARPDEPALGRETAAQARARFGAAVERALAAHPAGNLVIVTHGTVLTLFTAHHAGIEPLGFWRGLGMPAYAVFALPDLTLRAVVNEVAMP